MYAEDFSIYLAIEGTDAQLDGQSVRGIFDSTYVDPLGVAARETTFGLPTASCPDVAQNSVLFIPALPVVGTPATYRVAVPEPDGTGWTTLRLERTA